ncbi:MAG: class I SAM-dependent RNA methyltransferase, partial [Treponema sp.]|nr:class I SAM-dependent RNA methyltransferase [Treponema sp.]
MRAREMVELRIEKLAVGGDGLAFPDGKAVFVPGTIPGELVRASLSESVKASGDWASAEVRELLQASPDRVDPPCPLYGTCGGCSLQHLSYERQVREKAAILADCLSRIGGISVPDIGVVPSVPYSYRNRMQFHRSPGGGIGLKRRAGTEVVETPTCPVADLPIRRWMEAREGRGRVREDLRSYLAG